MTGLKFPQKFPPKTSYFLPLRWIKRYLIWCLSRPGISIEAQPKRFPDTCRAGCRGWAEVEPIQIHLAANVIWWWWRVRLVGRWGENLLFSEPERMRFDFLSGGEGSESPGWVLYPTVSINS